MTCAIGLTDGNRALIATDRRVAFSPKEATSGAPVRKIPGIRKVFRLHAYGPHGTGTHVVVAGTGPLAILAAIQYELPKYLSEPSGRSGAARAGQMPNDDDHIGEWVFRVGRKIDELVVGLGYGDEQGWAMGESLIAVRGTLWEVGGGTAMQASRGYSSIGSGSAYALGALHQLAAHRGAAPAPADDDGHWARLEATAAAAMDAATEHDPSVGDGYDIERAAPVRSR